MAQWKLKTPTECWVNKKTINFRSLWWITHRCIINSKKREHKHSNIYKHNRQTVERWMEVDRKAQLKNNGKCILPTSIKYAIERRHGLMDSLIFRPYSDKCLVFEYSFNPFAVSLRAQVPFVICHHQIYTKIWTHVSLRISWIFFPSKNNFELLKTI